MRTTDELVRKNENYARSFKKGDLPLPPQSTLQCSHAWTPASTSTRSSASRRVRPMSFATLAESPQTTRSGHW